MTEVLANNTSLDSVIQTENNVETSQSDNVWSKYSHAYNTLIPHFPIYQYLKHKVISSFKKIISYSEPKLIYDMGCGSGRMLKELAENGLVRAIEKNPEMFEIARDTHQVDPNIHISNDDITSLKLPTNEVDYFVFSNVLYHLPPEEASRVLDSTFNSLRPGGIVLIAGPKPNFNMVDVWNGEVPSLKAAGVFDRYPEEIDVFEACNKEIIKKGIFNACTNQELEQLLQTKGFNIFNSESIYHGHSYLVGAMKPLTFQDLRTSPIVIQNIARYLDIPNNLRLSKDDNLEMGVAVSSEDFAEIFALRFARYSHFDMIRFKTNPSKMLIDEFDKCSIQLYLRDLSIGKIIGTGRLTSKKHSILCSEDIYDYSKSVKDLESSAELSKYAIDQLSHHNPNIGISFLQFINEVARQTGHSSVLGITKTNLRSYIRRAGYKPLEEKVINVGEGIYSNVEVFPFRIEL
ncbi:MAG: methyltransferase domain-containing protein [Nanoarchaeota archaeon]|nr:methyltransferase domain-containing protein [Nanoarchaeota archaeon]